MANDEQLKINDDGIINQSMEEVMHNSMMPYAEYVILDRAIPRIEDGLKPVQRRILFAMSELGITPDKPHKKCARIVGECLGKYHPHGDTSVYGALVRMAQPFSMGQTLVDGHGNYGSVDGDPAAAMRYTEARMSELAEELLRDLDKDTVEWQLNFDDSLQEPTILPGRFPNLLVNGASGIAVGFSTQIPTHNLAEVIDGAIAVIDKPNIGLDELMGYIPAPDFPTGAYAIIGSELKQAYATGKGKLYIRAKMHIENAENDKKNIVITEFPYEEKKADLLEKIAALKDIDTAPPCMAGIADIVDESDKRGIRAVIKCKRDADLNGIIKNILKKTNLRKTCTITMIVIADGKPKQMGLLEILKFYVEYQRKIILKRSQYDYNLAEQRMEICEGLMIAIQNIDEVVKILKKASSQTDAKSKLKATFILSEKQACSILEMRLSRLVNLEVTKLEQEIAELSKLIETLKKIIASKKEQFNVVKKELREIKNKYKQLRKSTIITDESVLDNITSVTSDDRTGVVCLTANNCIKFVTERAYNTAIKNDEIGRAYDVLKQGFRTNLDKSVFAVTSEGNCCKLYFGNTEPSRWNASGDKLNVLCKDASKTERVVKFVSMDDYGNDEMLIFTAKGYCKRCKASEMVINKESYQIMGLKEGDEIIGIERADETKSLFIVTKNGYGLRCEISEIPCQARRSGGVICINMDESDSVIFAGLISDVGSIIVITNKYYVKKLMLNTFDVSKRYRKGVSVYPLSERLGAELISAAYVEHARKLGVVYDMDKALLFSLDALGEEGRSAKGQAILHNNEPYYINYVTLQPEL